MSKGWRWLIGKSAWCTGTRPDFRFLGVLQMLGEHFRLPVAPGEVETGNPGVSWLTRLAVLISAKFN